MTHMDFAILNNYVTVIYLRFMKSSNFFVIKRNNLKQLCFSLLFILVYMMCLYQFFYYMKLGLSASMFCQV